jgi:hypothetical protein
MVSAGRALPSGRPRAGVLFVGVCAAAYAAALLALRPGYQPSADSHYHFVMARMIARGHWVPDVAHALPFTVLRDMPVDHYWGYHVVLALFALLPSKELGMKVATVVLFAAVPLSSYLFLRARGVACAWAWALAAVLFSTQDWRYLQLRGGQLMVPLLFAMTEVAFFELRARRRRAWLVAIAYVAMLSYHGAVVLLPLHIGGTLALALFRPRPWRLAELFEPVLTLAGLALGLTLNPYMDGRASTWRFFALHVGEMGRDSAHLYDDQDIAEFHGFPARLLLMHPEWLLLLAAVVVAGALVVRRSRISRAEGAEGSTAPVVLLGMTVAGALLMTQAMRTREYAVPLAFALFATLAPKVESRSHSVLVAAVTAAAMVVHGRSTLPLIASHLPTAQYRGAKSLLEANGDRPILNMAEADCGMLLWEFDGAVCVQGLSRYFLYPYPALFHDVWELHDRGDTSEQTLAILRRFWLLGVRLVAIHRTHKMATYAEAHPEVLSLAFRSPINGASIYALDGRAFAPHP